jgi:mono/diheme cytochrome c family protein
MPLTTSHTLYARLSLWCAVACAGLTAVSPAQADSKRPNVPLLPKYQQECAACHIAYPPGMLPAGSWARMTSTLNKHYGTDASLDDASVREISKWLQVNAGTYKRVKEEPPEDRITQTAWFVRKHRELDAAVWRHVSVKSAAHCAACHTRADKGEYDDAGLKFPAGLPERYRRAWSD